MTKPYNDLLSIDNQNFIWGNDLLMAEGGKSFSYLNDHLGSPIRLVGETQEETLAYDEFGVPTVEATQNDDGNLNNPFGFTGYQLDDVSGLYFAQARWYGADSGRFVSEDLVRSTSHKMVNGQEIPDPLSFNLYNYCYNNPVLYHDLDGRTAAIPMETIKNLSQLLPWLVGGITTAFTSIKTAAATSWAPVVAVSAITLGAIAIGVIINETIKYAAEAERVREWAYAQVEAGGIKKEDLYDYSVYTIIERSSSEVYYVGITRDYDNRQYRHQRAPGAIYPIDEYLMIPVITGLTMEDARAWEQALITGFTLEALNNMRNSISPSKWGDFANEFERVNSLIGCYIND